MNRPLLAGEVSLEIGWGLERTLQIINDLCNEGVLQSATPEERANYDLHPEACLFSLAVPRNLALAHR